MMGAASSVKVFGVAITSEVAPHGCDAHGCAGGPQPPASGVAWAADIKTTQVYTHYAPDEHEIAMVNAGFGGESLGSNLGSNVSAAQGKSARATPSNHRG